MRPLALSLALLLAASPLAHAEIEFTGMIEFGDKSTYGLVETETSQTQWRGVGQTFNGWTLASYDAKNETLALTRDGVNKTVKLKTAAAVESPAPGDPAIIAGEVEIKINDKTVSQPAAFTIGQTSVIPGTDGTTVKVTPTQMTESNGPAAIRYQLSFERAGTNGKPAEIISNPSVAALPGNAFSISVGGTSFKFTPKPADAKPAGNAPAASPPPPAAARP